MSSITKKLEEYLPLFKFFEQQGASQKFIEQHFWGIVYEHFGFEASLDIIHSLFKFEIEQKKQKQFLMDNSYGAAISLMGVKKFKITKDNFTTVLYAIAAMFEFSAKYPVQIDLMDKVKEFYKSNPEVLDFFIRDDNNNIKHNRVQKVVKWLQADMETNWMDILKETEIYEVENF